MARRRSRLHGASIEHAREAQRFLSQTVRLLTDPGPRSCVAAEAHLTAVAKILGGAIVHVADSDPDSGDKERLRYANELFKAKNKVFRNTCVRGGKAVVTLSGMRRRSRRK